MREALSLRKPPLYRSRPFGPNPTDQGGKALDLEARPPDQTPIHVRLAHEFGNVVRLDAAAVENAAALRGISAKPLTEPTANVLVRFLCLRGGRIPSGPNGPHGLVGDDEIRHLLAGEPVEPVLDLPIEHGKRLVAL